MNITLKVGDKLVERKNEAVITKIEDGMVHIYAEKAINEKNHSAPIDAVLSAIERGGFKLVKGDCNE